MNKGMKKLCCCEERKITMNSEVDDVNFVLNLVFFLLAFKENWWGWGEDKWKNEKNQKKFMSLSYFYLPPRHNLLFSHLYYVIFL